MRVLVTGADGQLGYDVCRELDRRGIPYLGASRRKLDITVRQEVQRCFMDYHPDAVIHCAAYTAVDSAEREREAAFQVNGEGTANLARAAGEAGARMVYVSTDYVFSGEGEQPYETDAPAGPLNVYGASKLAGEEAVRGLLKSHFIVRTSWLYGKHGDNFVKTMLRLGRARESLDVVGDQIGSPTYTVDLAGLLCDMAGSGRYGTYHAANAGYCSRAEFAREIFRLAGLPVRVNPVLTAGLPSPARRPLNSRLSTTRLLEAGFHVLPKWDGALKQYLKSEVTLEQ